MRAIAKGEILGLKSGDAEKAGFETVGFVKVSFVKTFCEKLESETYVFVTGEKLDS